jgi:hypothetical protein
MHMLKLVIVTTLLGRTEADNERHVIEQGGVSCLDPNSSEDLAEAVDAAMMELQGTKGWFHGLRTTSGYTGALGIFSCTPDAQKWVYPSADKADGILKRVLDSGKIRVAGVQWAVPSGAADYKSDPLNPVGFWPSYMNAIAERMSANYGKTITVERVYYASSVLVVDKVAEGVEVDMSEPYYYISGFHVNEPRIEALDFSCVTAGTASKFYTKKGSGITTTDQLFDAIAAGPNRAVGFIGQGNYDSVSATLPDSVSPTFTTDSADMAANVLSGALVAGYMSEGNANTTLFEVFETGIISPRVALFHRDVPTCSTSLMPATVAIAIVVLILALLLLLVIARERQQKPLFMPLLKQTTVESVKPQL